MGSRSEPDAPRALITGHDGFTGRYVAREMRAAGYRVFGLSHTPTGTGGEAFVADLQDRAAVRDVVDHARADVVVHLAAIAFVAHGDADALYKVNVLGTRTLLEALAQAAHAPRVVVLASSANVYGNTTADRLGEDTAPAPANDYAVSKLAMEYMARLWMDRLPIVITRPFNYTGVGQGSQFLIPKIVGHFRRREAEIELGNVHVWRDFSDVRMVAAAYRGLVEAAPAGNVYNICSGQAHSLEDVLDMMARIAGYRIVVRVNPAFVRDSEVIRLVGDNRLLLGVTGGLRHVCLEETLRWMYAEKGKTTEPG